MPVIHKKDLSALELPGRTLRIVPDQGVGPKFNFIFTDIPPGNSLPLRARENEAETMYIIAGNARLNMTVR
ncbi:MAG: hypothetical protein LBE10_05945 [Treponema sp.]|jgi:hypothetical protein|nr:hypothetical protein [Treponema sp.]